MQILVIALIILLLFGASRLGEVGKGLGEGIKNFKKGVAGDDADDAKEKDDKGSKQLKGEGESAAKKEESKEEKS